MAGEFDDFDYMEFIDHDALKKERAKAKELRQSGWWKNLKSSGVCYYCNKNVGAVNLTMDHKVPLIQGGRSTKKNIVPACKDCNSAKQNKSLGTWEDEKQKNDP